jgi:hypothetical protein
MDPEFMYRLHHEPVANGKKNSAEIGAGNGTVTRVGGYESPVAVDEVIRVVAPPGAGR